MNKEELLTFTLWTGKTPSTTMTPFKSVKMTQEEVINLCAANNLSKKKRFWLAWTTDNEKIRGKVQYDNSYS